MARDNRLTRFFQALLSGRLRIVLVVSFIVVTVLTVGLGALVTSRVINEYLANAMAERVARDMDLAEAFYRLKQDEIAAISYRLVLDPWVVENLPAAVEGDLAARQVIDQQIVNKITVLALGGTHMIAVLDTEGNFLAGQVLSSDGTLSPVPRDGNWGALPIFAEALRYGEGQAATEVIPREFLAQVGLADQAYVELLETPLAMPEPYDPREGTAGLALTGVYPVRADDGAVIGVVLSAYLFNNDFTLVDRIREVAGIDTVTIFFGDLRISTNVRNADGTRAVGTRISQDVFDVVLRQGEDYVGRAYVVNDWFITRYTPLRDYQGLVVGSLYVGARESTFRRLVVSFNQEVALIALVSLVFAAVIAVPIARIITRPITELVDANRRLAQGDMTVRVETHGNGELAMLGRSFNALAETLHKTQQELLQKEKLASMGQLAAGVAHEINNPLGTILLFAEAMSKETPPEHAHQQDLQMIIKETTRCKSIVADLLNFARQQEVLAQETDVHQLLRQVVNSVSHQPSFEGIEVSFRFSDDLPRIQADPAQLQQVFINLLNNAAESTQGSGAITITTRPVSGWVEVQVADTGAGIPEENLGKLFTPFFTTKPLGKGTGLGLSIVYGIVKMHRGQITVQSEVGKGTTFTVTLPVRLPGDGQAPKSGAIEVIG